MAPKRKKELDLDAVNESAIARRSRRLRGAVVEFSENALEQIEMERRSSRSRSRSATPSAIRSSKLEASLGLTKISAAGPSNSPPPICPQLSLAQSANLSTTLSSKDSPQRLRIDFDDSGANDSFETSKRRSSGGQKRRISRQSLMERERTCAGRPSKMPSVGTDENDEQNDNKEEAKVVEENKEEEEVEVEVSDEEEKEVEEEKVEEDDEEEEELDEDERAKGKMEEEEEVEQNDEEEEEVEENEEEESGGGDDELFSEDEQTDEGGKKAKGRKQKAKALLEMTNTREEEMQEEGTTVAVDGNMAEKCADNEREDEISDAEENADEGEDNEEEEDNGKEEKDESECSYEEDIEDAKTVMKRRGKLPSSAVDDKFFNLAEMNAFLDAEDKKEEENMTKNRNLGDIDNADEMEQLISSYEQANLQPRDWALSGEAKAEERPKDALLDQFVDADYRLKAPPTISEEMTTQLEAIITKRIKNGLFDDVVRKVRVNEALVPATPYRNATIIGATTEQKVRKSLAEVYGDKFSAGLNEGDDDDRNKDQLSKLDPTVEAIKKDLDVLFLKLDALSHFQFRPQPIQEEVKIVKNLPSLHMEEVGPQAAVGPEVNLLAPEEVKRSEKSAPKAADERTDTDRKRERRQKKKKQRILASIGAMNGGEGTGGGEATERTKKKKVNVRTKMDFAEQIHKLVLGGGQQQQKRKRRMIGENGEEKNRAKKKSKIGEQE